MIREGKEDGWLRLTLGSLNSFLRLHNIETTDVEAVSTTSKGNGLVAKHDLDLQKNPLVLVPSNLIVSKESVLQMAKIDPRLQEVLEACGDFASASEIIAVRHAIADYIKFLPVELLPTFWTDEECALFEGTSLKPAHDAKMHSLYREFDELRRSTSDIPWCKDLWWDETDGILDFDDWKQVDAMYRSRALEFPGIGDALVSYIGFANHASGGNTTARYQADANGNGLLLIEDNKTLKEGEEITITYGDDKGACEMIYSYGFLEEGMDSAKTVFLDIDIPETDPLKRPKRAWDPCAPGVRLTVSNEEVSWESDYIWVAVLNQEDGLEFVIAQTVDGDRELRLQFKGLHVTGMEELKQLIEQSDMFDVFQLRAIVLLETRVLSQLETLGSVDERYAGSRAGLEHIRQRPKELAERLRSLEGRLLGECAQYFEQEKVRLAKTDVVQAYLQSQQSGEDEDFA